MPKRSDELDIIAQLATTSLSPTESHKPQGIQKAEPRTYNFVSSTISTNNPRNPSTDEETEDEEEEEEVHVTSNSSRKVNYACTECRKAHKACSGGRPCERCAKLGIDSKCRSSTRKKRILTKKYWFDFLQQQQQQQTGGVKQPIFVDHFAVENMKQQLENKVIQRQKHQDFPRTNETFQFSTYVPPVQVSGVSNVSQQINYRQEGSVLSPRTEGLYSSPRPGIEQSPRNTGVLSSPRPNLEQSPRVHANTHLDLGSLHSPRFVQQQQQQQQYQQQQQGLYDSPRLHPQQQQQMTPRMEQLTPRMEQLVSPRIQQYQQQQQISSPRNLQQQQQFQQQQQQPPQQSPRFNVLPNPTQQLSFTPPPFDNVNANVYQSPRLGTGISPRITEQNVQSPRMGIMSPRLVEQNLVSPRGVPNTTFSPRIVQEQQHISSPRAPFSPRTSFSPPSSLESYKIGRPNAVISPQESLPSMPHLESISELTKNMSVSSPRFVQKFMEHPFVESSPRNLQQQQYQQQYQQQQQFNNQQWR